VCEPLRNYTQAAQWLGVPRKWLEAEVQAGRAPHTRLGRHVRFTQGHLDAIVAAGERLPAPVPVPVPDPASPRLRGRGRRSA